MKTPALKGRELFDWLVTNKRELIDAKKSATKYADITTVVEFETPIANKARVLYENDTEAGTLKRSIVANTYNFLDSHGDVHVPGIFTKSIQERGTRIPHLHDHKFEIGAKVGRALSISEVAMKWRALGHPKNGETTVLLMESQIEKDMNPTVFREYLNDHVDQHSVGMQYVTMQLAVNDENYPNEYKVWQEIYPSLGNKSEADAQEYFWAIREAKLIEVSAVLMGSNPITPTLNNKVQPVDTTDTKQEDTAPLQVKEVLKFYQPSQWTQKSLKK